MAARGRWAPWWVYVVVVVGLNQLRQVLIEPGDNVPLDVGLAAAAVVLGFGGVTAIYRTLAGPTRDRSDDHEESRSL